MSKFMHNLAEALRGREKLLEDHSTHPVLETEAGKPLKAEYDELLSEIKAFSEKLEKAQEKGKDIDEHFEREIGDDHNRISVKIDAWAKKLP